MNRIWVESCPKAEDRKHLWKDIADGMQECQLCGKKQRKR